MENDKQGWSGKFVGKQYHNRGNKHA